MVAEWRPVSSSGGNNFTKANCIFNFNVPPEPNAIYKLSLVLGDPVVILRERNDWYYGHTLANEAHKGIFPKEYVRLRNSDDDKEPLVEEINSSLREWNEIMKEKYLENNDKQKLIQGLIKDVTRNRTRLAKGKLPFEEARETRQNIVTKADFLNNDLALDLIVRDEDGNVLSPDKSSAVSLYRHHVEANNTVKVKMKSVTVKFQPENLEGIGSYRVVVSVKNFASLKVNEDVDLVISLYEASDGCAKPICENFVIESWRNNVSAANSNNLRVQFADINKKDIQHNDIWLVCHVISLGNFSNTVLTSAEDIKRVNFHKPVGIAAKKITDLFTFQKGQNVVDEDVKCSFLKGDYEESLEKTLRKLIFEEKSVNAEWAVLKCHIQINLGEIQQLYDAVRVPTAKNLSLPDVIMPNDVRNDLYVHIMNGKFSKLDKIGDRNVEMIMEVCDEDGKIVPDSICVGVGTEQRNCYKGVVYYHVNSPQWGEWVRVDLPAEQFRSCHLRFTFVHKNGKKMKNTNEAYNTPWALSYMKLVKDEYETVVRDQIHELIVYKIEKNVEVTDTAFYLKLPSLKKDMEKTNKTKTVMGLTQITKDFFNISTSLASTMLTQNEGLLSLLKWSSEPENLRQNLSIFNHKINPREAKSCRELVKLMPQALDCVFSILTAHEQYEKDVFKSLVNILLMITDGQFVKFIPVLDLYIKENFSAPLAHNKLLLVLSDLIGNATTRPKDLGDGMKVLQYIIKFVVKSRELKCNIQGNGDQEEFEDLLRSVLVELVKMMNFNVDEMKTAQSQCMKQIILSVPELMTVYDKKNLTQVIIQMIDSPVKQLEESKIETIKELVNCPLFENADCRELLLPAMIKHIEEYMRKEILTEKVNETLGNILDKLTNVQPRDRDIGEIMTTCLRTLIQTAVAERKKRRISSSMHPIISNLICLLNEMTPPHYSQYIESFGITERSTREAGRYDLIEFISEVLELFKDLIENNAFPREWNTMIMLLNSVVMKALCQFANTIRDYFCHDSEFEINLWTKFFQCAISFIKQPSMQLGKFSENKRLKILNTYGDMRKNMGIEVKQMWYNLGKHKISFIPHMVGDFLKMALIPEQELQKHIIPIFFDMIQCEFYSERFQKDATKRDATQTKANFHEFQNELIWKLDQFIADEHYGNDLFKHNFESIMMDHCEKHTSIRDPGIKYVKLTTRLIELLLDYRDTKISNDSKMNLMSCTVNLINFYNPDNIHGDLAANILELYVKYLRELSELHQKSQHHAEAGFTILKFASPLLQWSDQPLEFRWNEKDEMMRKCKNHRQLKEQLYKEIIEMFDKGKVWEIALGICEELLNEYKCVTFDYNKISSILEKMSKFYANIMNGEEEVERCPEYFRVDFIGRGFPSFLQNKTFIYRGRGFERRGEFVIRIMDQFPDAEEKKKLGAPTQEEKDSPKQLIQINQVKPVMDEKPEFQDKTISPQILKYYKLNEVSRFQEDKPYHKGQKDKENEIKTLWLERKIVRIRDSLPGMLQWSPVVEHEIIQLTPLDNAIETMEVANNSIRDLIQEFKVKKDAQVNKLSMKIKGIIDAEVNGGTAMYERAFINDQYEEAHPEDMEKIDRLKDLMATQIPLLSIGLQIHDFKKPESLTMFHEQLENMFQQMKKKVEEKYGTRPSEFAINTKQERTISDQEIELRGGSHQNDSHHQNTSSGGTSVSAMPKISVNTFDNNNDNATRESYHSQNSVDGTPMSRAKGFGASVFGGIARRKSNLGHNLNRNDESRASVNSNASMQNNHQGSNSHNRSVDTLNSLDDATTMIITDTIRHTTNNSTTRQNSRPSSGSHQQYFLNSTSTPNHSRSPSMTSNSNRDSMISNASNSSNVDVPPSLPPKRDMYSNGGADTFSLTNFGDTSSNNSGSQEEIYNLRKLTKKKGPPPPPPIIDETEVTPTPPRKPALRPPT